MESVGIMHLKGNLDAQPMKNAYSVPYLFKVKIILVTFLFCSFIASAQDTLSWINKNAYELQSNTDSTSKDLTFLQKELNGKNIIGLGEASHGTKEFFNEKARIVEYLIRNCNFKLLTIECPDSTIVPINDYLQTGIGNLKALMRNMALYSTEEIYNLFQNIRQYNKDKPATERVLLVGFDKEDYWGDPYTRDQFMSENLIHAQQVKQSKTIVWTHNVHMLKDTTSEVPPLASYLNKHYGNSFYAIGFDTFKGTVNILNDGEFEQHSFQAEENTLSNVLAQAQYKSFFLPFKADHPFSAAPSLITNIYSNWQGLKPLPIKAGKDFDALIFVRETTASTRLSIK
jgi:erythromycin esterase-like protein